MIEKLEKHSEDRGDLYVIESEVDLISSNYYIIDSTTILKGLNYDFSIIVVKGEVETKGGNYGMGFFIKQISKKDVVSFSSEFIGVLLSNDKLIIPKIELGGLVVKRIFFVVNMPIGSVRGDHAHSEETEFIYVLNGDFKIQIKENNAFLNDFLTKGSSIISKPKAWTHITSLSENSILLAFLSHAYNANGFI